MKRFAGTGRAKLLLFYMGIIVFSLLGACNSGSSDGGGSGSAVIIDHACTDIDTVPEAWIEEAKSALHIAYGHTSHGSQLTTGMTGLVTFKGDLYEYNSGGIGGALDLRDTPFSGASDLGNPDRTSWATATRSYLDANSDVERCRLVVVRPGFIRLGSGY